MNLGEFIHSVDHARMYMKGSSFLFQDEIIFVKNVEPDVLVVKDTKNFPLIIKINTRRAVRVNSKELRQFSSHLKLGWCESIRGRPVSILHKPVRRCKAGFCFDDLSMSVYTTDGRTMSCDNVTYEELIKTFRGRKKKQLSKVDINDGEFTILSNEWLLIHNDQSLQYYGRPGLALAFVNFKRRVIRIPDKFSVLSPVLKGEFSWQQN